MLENLSAVVGLAMHDDLLMRPKKDARVAEAEREWQRSAARTVRRPGSRVVLAQWLIALATRLAPAMQERQPVA
jgi:hypothetical protein